MEKPRVGRPPLYRNAAEKQKAYRQRQKRQKQASELALWLLREIENEKVVLLKSVDWHRQKGESVEVRLIEPAILDFNPSPDAYANGRFFTSIDLTLFRYLVRTGELIFKEKHWAGAKYTFKD